MNQIWLEVSIDTRSAALEALAAYLTACGIVGLVLEDENDLAQFEDERTTWRSLKMKTAPSGRRWTRACATPCAGSPA